MLTTKHLVEVTVTLPKVMLNDLATQLINTGIYHPRQLDKNVPGQEEHKAKRSLYEIEGKLRKLEKYLSEIEVYNPLEKTNIELEKKAWMDLAEVSLLEFQPLEEKNDAILDQILKAKERLENLEKMREFLEPIKDMDIDLEKTSSLKNIIVYIGFLKQENRQVLLSKISKIDAYLLDEKQIDEDTFIVMLAVPREKSTELNIIVREASIQQLQLPEGYPSNPKEAYEKVIRELEEHEKKIAGLKSILEQQKQQLIQYYNKFYSIREALRILSAAKIKGEIAFASGFIPVDTRKTFEKLVEKATNNTHILVYGRYVKGSKETNVPSLVKVPKLLKPFHWIVTQYGTPRTGELIPTVFLAITFPLIYGFMFPDLGHGIAIVLFGLFLLKTAKGRESRFNVGMIAIYVGITSSIIGFLSGEFFGPLTHFKDIVWGGHPPLESPIEAGAEGNAIEIIMTIVFKIASFLLITGTLFGFLNSLVLGEKHEAIFVKLPKFIIFTSATYPFLLYTVGTAGSIIYDASFGGATTIQGQIVRYGFLAGLILLMVLEPVYEGIKHGASFLKSRLGMAALETFETVLLVIGNTASFLRIMGLSMAHSGIMFGFALLATIVSGGIIGKGIGLIIYILGNLLAIGLEGIIVYAQTLRLHYYEWFTKFYSGSGMPFTPVYSPAIIVFK